MGYNPQPMAQRRKIRSVWLVTPLILLFFFLALDSLVDDSPTMDEQNHLARGLAYVRTGDPRLSVEHPPLVNSLSALPLLTLPDIRLPTDHPSWQRQPPDIFWYIFADQLLWQYNQDVTRMLFLARLPIVFLTIGLALVGYHFAGQIWRRPSALLAFFLLLFDPNIIAHGRYTTTDLGGTLFVFLATFLLWRLWQVEAWSWSRWLLSAVGMALAFGSKLSTLAFVPIWVVVALLPIFGRSWGRRDAFKRLLQLGTAGLLSILVVWLIFGFEWGPFTFLDERLAVLNQRSGPMPTFWSGIERILILNSGGRSSFLLGQQSSEGFLAYFPIALATKTPLPTLILWLLAAVFLLVRKVSRGRAIFLLLPALLYFGLSLQSALNIGYRHLFPMLPFIYVLISGLVSQSWSPRRIIPGWQRQFAPVMVLVAVLAASLLISTLRIHPHYLSYFNLIAGGPENGHTILIDSNIDWGQDLFRLQQWMADNEVKQIKLAWFGTADPAYYGLPHQPLPGFPLGRYYSLWYPPPFNPEAPEPGIYAISVSSLWESHWDTKITYPWFRAREPDDRVGYSIFIYEVP